MSTYAGNPKSPKVINPLKITLVQYLICYYIHVFHMKPKFASAVNNDYEMIDQF